MTLSNITATSDLPNVKRDKNNYRVFDDDINFINGLVCLRKCGMSIKEMKKYVDLCLVGESSIIVRQKMLSKKLEYLYFQIDEIKESIDYINRKNKFYTEVLEGKKDYFSFINKK